MLFSSFEFLFLFLPISAIVFYSIGNIAHNRVAIFWLVGASLFFYGWWNPAYLGLIIGSTVFNYSLGIVLCSKTESSAKFSKLLLVAGVITNLALLAYFKYANFFVDNINTILGTGYDIGTIVLPLAISFFTFQQIAFLVDAYRGETREYSFLHYFLFVTFFPQLIAGPIVHHKEILPQFLSDRLYKFDFERIAIGVSIIIIGLFKKVVIADQVAVYVDPVFDAAESGLNISFLEAWGSALAYTVQIYFDFSGYVDMATGAAQIFGIVLPLNFYSPYKARNIIEFWRCWHMTLSRFLRDYLYISLGGGRKGVYRRYFNLMMTMLLGGLWHGAGWTFVFWGFLHGFYLVINHGWRGITAKFNIRSADDSRLIATIYWLITFFAVVFAWVYFRAESFTGASQIISAMLGSGFSSLPDSLSGRLGGMESVLINLGFTFDNTIIIGLRLWLKGAVLIVIGLSVAFYLPNSNQLFEKDRSSALIAWRPSFYWVTILFLMFSASILNLFKVSPFLYFNF